MRKVLTSFRQLFPIFKKKDTVVLTHRWQLYKNDEKCDDNINLVKQNNFIFGKVDNANEDHCGICASDPESVFKNNKNQRKK